MTVKRIIFRTLLAFFVLAIVLSSFLAWLLLTASGLAFAAHQAERFVPGFKLENVAGDWGDLTVTGLELDIPGVKAKVGEIRFGLAWREIAQGRIHIKTAALSGVELDVATAELQASEPKEDPAPSSGPLTLPAGWAVIVDRAALSKADASVDGMKAVVGDFAASMTWSGDVMEFKEIALADAAFQMPGVDASMRRLAAAVSYSFDPDKGLDVEGIGINGVRTVVETARLADGGSGAADQKHEKSTASPAVVESAPIMAPFAMKLGGLSAGDLAVEIDGSRVSIDELRLAADWTGNAAAVTESTIKGVRAVLAEPAAAEKAGGKPAEQPAASVVKTAAVEPAGEGAVDGSQAADGVQAVVQGLGEALEKRFEAPLVAALPEVHLPLALSVADFRLEDVVVENIPGVDPKVMPALAPLTVARLTSAFSLKGSKAEIARFEVQSSAGRIDFRADIDLSGAWPISGELAVDTDYVYFTNALGVPSAEASLKAVLSGEVLDSLKSRTTLRGAWAADFNAMAGLGLPGLPFKFELAAAELRWPLPGAVFEAAPSANAAEKSGANADSAGSRKMQAHTGTQTEKTAQTARTDAASAPQRFLVKNFTIALDGSVKAWTLTGGAVVEAQDLKIGAAEGFKGQFVLKGAGTASHAAVTEASFKSPWGSADWSAEADWLREPRWKTAFKADGFNAAVFFPKIPMTLSASAAADGSFSIDWRDWQLEVTKLDVSGGIAGAPLGLSGRAALSSDRRAKLDGIHVLVGKNTIDLDGEANDLTDVRLALKIDAPGFINSFPGLKGQARGYVNLTGSVFRPAVKADLHVAGLGWENVFSVGDIRLKADVRNRIKAIESGAMKAKAEAVRAARAQAGFSVDQSIDDLAAAFAIGELSGSWSLVVKDIDASGQHVDALELGGTGDESFNKSYLKTAGGIVSGSAELSGRVDRQTLRWQGALERAAFETPVGPWTLRKAAPLSFDLPTKSFTLGAQCWENPDAEICVPKTYSIGRQGEFHADLKRLDMAILKPWLRRRDKVSGTLSGSVEAKWNADQPGLPDVKAVLTGDGLSAQTRYQGVAVPVTFEKLRVSASIQKGAAQALLRIKPVDSGDVGLSLAVGDLEGARTLSGRLLMTDVTPSLLKPFLSQGEKTEGRMSADLRMGGTLASPSLTGDFRLTQLQLDAAFIPIDMQPSDITLTFEGQRSTLQGRIETTQGAIDLSGSADWRTLNDWRAKVGVKTDKIRATMPPMIKVDVTSDVWAEATPELITLGGRIDVPWADIVVGTLPDSGVSISADEVILGDDLQPAAPPSTPIAVKSSIIVTIGPKVAIDAFGLKAGLTGSLVVVQDGELLGLNGQIKIPYGRFHAYGQDLLVRQGTVVFSGPAGNPSLNIEAIRNPEATEDDVTAGIRVAGSAAQPKVSIFTEPSKSQSEALSYLIRGQGLDTEDGSSNAMTSMLIGLGATTGSSILSEVGDAMGIQGLGLDTTGVGDSQQVVVSGYVLPGLQVKYGIGIFDSLATLTLRYRLMPRLYLKAVSSVDQALDLLYRFDF